MLAALEGNQKSSFVCSISARKIRIWPNFHESANILSLMAKPKVNRIAQRPLSVDSLYKYNFMILETLEGTQKNSSVCSISDRKVRIWKKKRGGNYRCYGFKAAQYYTCFVFISRRHSLYTEIPYKGSLSFRLIYCIQNEFICNATFYILKDGV